MPVATAAGSLTDTDTNLLFARLSFGFEEVRFCQQTVRLTDSAALLSFAMNPTRAVIAEGPILLDASAAARFGEIVAEGRVDLPEPPVDLDAFN